MADESGKKVKMAEEEERKVILRSNDNHEFVISESLTKESKTLTHLVDDVGPDTPVTLPNVNGGSLAKIVEYWRAHKSEDKDEEVKKLEEAFANMERNELFDLVNATNYLDTKPLLDAQCEAVAGNIKKMSVEQVRDYFGIENDFTPEEEAELRKENEWAFE